MDKTIPENSNILGHNENAVKTKVWIKHRLKSSV
jgi:hypothetical protein